MSLSTEPVTATLYGKGDFPINWKSWDNIIQDGRYDSKCNPGGHHALDEASGRFYSGRSPTEAQVVGTTFLETGHRADFKASKRNHFKRSV